MNGGQSSPDSREKEIFLSAIDKATPQDRAAYVNAACAGDDKLKAAVEELLRNHVADAFLEQPATLIDAAAKAQRRKAAAAGSPFAPGELFAGRYRIVGLLGEGGMGQVYRADDLKLGQSVALKFLPPALATDPVWLLRFRNEVRIAREVSHPNVCRVYDIGEAEGEHFISMEFVDGEDLTSLLRRIGRLPQDKAVEIARQLCAGLAAAHARGVVHRDLKPANIMIDGRGKVRITDFGIAALADQIQGKETRAGTPSYMAPEQLAGTEVTTRSDIYALGLVLYEIFTGKKAIEGTSITQVERAQSRGAPPTPASHVRDIDPQVERIILRCLEPDPKNRPRSAMAVAAALPGMDLLAEAIAAGDTPSPELLAEAGESGSLPHWVAISCFVGVVAGLVTIIGFKDKTNLLLLVPFNKLPEVLAERAEQVSERLGYTNVPADKAYWFRTDPAVMRYLTNSPPASNRWQRLASGWPAAVVFSYRAASQKLTPQQPDARVRWSDPPFSEPGMRRMNLDTKGRLISFHAVPPKFSETKLTNQEADWSLLFREAGLELTNFNRVDSNWTPEMYCDIRVAWTGTHPNWPTETLRVEAGSFAGTPVFFELRGPWTKTPNPKPGNSQGDRPLYGTVLSVVWAVIFFAVLATAAYFARRNLFTGRGDRTGARRLGLYIFLLSLGEFATTTHAWVFWGNVTRAFATMAGTAFLTWLLYIAIEPSARRYWPHTLISWSRLLTGRIRDPSIGRDVLGGCFGGMFIKVLETVGGQLPQSWTGADPTEPFIPGRAALLSGGFHVVARILDGLGGAGGVMGIFLFLLLLRILFKRNWVTAVVFVGLWGIGIINTPSAPLAAWVWSFSWATIIVVTTIRFGLLALFVMFVSMGFIESFPATFDFSAWWAGIGIIGPLFVIGLASYGCWVSMAGKPLFKDEVLAK
ncbi:MAG: serine/threonine protein kinase [Verrucomicrobia bacterium]|nr:serine/threonine protein kinase [Verrucomicrobiota bacterium]